LELFILKVLILFFIIIILGVYECEYD